MELRKLGRLAMALAVSLGVVLGVASCTTDNTIGYFWVTSSQFNEISGYLIDNNYGQLKASPKSPYSSGGVNPVRAVVANSGDFLYVLNAGCGEAAEPACAPSIAPSLANITEFIIGGAGSLTFQESYNSQGEGPVSLIADSSGRYLYVLDSRAPDPTTCVGYVSTNPATACGDITAFSIDSSTGRLTLILNQEVVGSNGKYLTYFPVGSGPIYFADYNNTYIYTIEKGSGTGLDPLQAVYVYNLIQTSGQLTLTQNTPIPTGATDLTFIYCSSSYIYLLDAGNETTAGSILPYTSASSGALQSLVGGVVPNTGTTANPSSMIVDHTNKFVYVANSGPNLTPTSPSGSVSGFFITPITGQLVPLTSGVAANSVPFGAAAEPQCILEDPSNQYIYTANYGGSGGSSITGAVLNQEAGTLTTLRKSTSFPTAGQPTWCVASGTLF